MVRPTSPAPTSSAASAICRASCAWAARITARISSDVSCAGRDRMRSLSCRRVTPPDESTVTSTTPSVDRAVAVIPAARSDNALAWAARRLDRRLPVVDPSIGRVQVPTQFPAKHATTVLNRLRLGNAGGFTRCAVHRPA